MTEESNAPIARSPSERKVTRLYCSRAEKPHEVGRAQATPQGLLVTYLQAVDGANGTVHYVRTHWRENDAVESDQAWCKVCRKRHTLVLNDVIEAARAGRRAMLLVAEGMERDPIGVLDRADEQKA